MRSVGPLHMFFLQGFKSNVNIRIVAGFFKMVEMKKLGDTCGKCPLTEMGSSALPGTSHYRTKSSMAMMVMN